MHPLPRPIKSSELIFPSAHKSITQTLGELKRSSLSITNRLHSICHDAAFVQKVAGAYQLPLVANERCGSWYIDPALKVGSAYFKSTDGHFGEWAFSLRRLNLQVLDAIKGKGGCIIVDSTRRGKSMPDALCKTVPIWVSVLNRLLFPDEPISHVLRTPKDIVSKSEHSQIDQRLPRFVEEVRRLDLDLDSWRSKLSGRPMLVEWVTPDSALPKGPSVQADWNFVVLCTASGRTVIDRQTSFEYVQGAADDQEAWACGLSPQQFWSYKTTLLSIPEDNLPTEIAAISSNNCDSERVRAPVSIEPTHHVCIGSNTAVEAHASGFDLVVSCSEKPSQRLVESLKDRYVHLRCSHGKVGSRQLRLVLPLLEAATSKMTRSQRVFVACPTGRDLAIGVALAILCLRYDESGSMMLVESASELSKAAIKHRLSWIMVSMPDAAPSRATLQSVNAFLLG